MLFFKYINVEIQLDYKRSRNTKIVDDVVHIAVLLVSTFQRDDIAHINFLLEIGQCFSYISISRLLVSTFQRDDIAHINFLLEIGQCLSYINISRLFSFLLFPTILICLLNLLTLIGCFLV